MCIKQEHSESEYLCQVPSILLLSAMIKIFSKFQDPDGLPPKSIVVCVIVDII